MDGEAENGRIDGNDEPIGGSDTTNHSTTIRDNGGNGSANRRSYRSALETAFSGKRESDESSVGRGASASTGSGSGIDSETAGTAGRSTGDSGAPDSRS